MTRDLWTQLFAIRLRAKMAAANISSAELAGKYEFWTEGLIESYRKGKTIPPAYDLALLANTLGCTIEYLADFKMLSGLNEKECMKILELSEKYQIVRRGGDTVADGTAESVQPLHRVQIVSVGANAAHTGE